MKTITLKKLTLQDWRGQNREVEFGNVTEIKGRNKAGKSSIFNAFLWLFTSCDELNRTNHKLYDDTLPITFENAKVASVEAELLIDGTEYILKKTAKQGWSRKRGREEYEKSNTDNYNFYIDGIERTSGEYKTFIENTLAPIDKLKMMLNIKYYQLLDYKEMRKYFESLVGDIAITDFKADYSEILNDLNKYPIEEVKMSYKSKIKPIKTSIESLPITIDTLQANLPNINSLSEIQKEIDEAKEQISNIDAQLLGANESIQVYIDKRNSELKAISELEREFAELENKYNTKPIYEANKIKAKIAEIDENNKLIDRENKKNKQILDDAIREIELAKERLRYYEDYRKVLLKENEEVKAMQFEGVICSYCGQPLQGDKLEEAKQKFFARRDAKHKSIVATGKENNEKINKCKTEIAEFEAIIAKGYEEKPLLDKSLLENGLAELRARFTPYKETTEGRGKLAKIENLKANLTNIPQHDNSGLQNMKKMLLESIENNSKKLGLKDEYDKQILNIQNKQAELKDSVIALAKLEKKLNLVAQYEQERAQIVSDRVNGLFDYISVRMTSTNKSGDIVPDCQILDKFGVSANVCNAASAKLCGIDLSLGFQKFYGLNLPIFIDEAHTIDEDNYPTIDNQIIKLWNNGGDFEVVCR